MTDTLRKVMFRYSPLLLIAVAALLWQTAAQAGAGDIVLYASEATTRAGNWAVVNDATAAGGARLANADQSGAKLATPLAVPGSYFEINFNAQSNVAYRLWIRGKAQGDSPYNDSIFVQFSGSVTSAGAPVYRIGTTDGTCINLEEDLNNGLSGWGWQDNGWGVNVMGPLIYFSSTGTQTLRIQPREDGLSIDQIVLSPATYLNKSPGTLKNDTTILPKTGAPAPNPAPTVSSISPGSGPTAGGTPVTITGTGFASGATVTLGGSAATNVAVANSTTITATTPAHAAGAVNIVVTNADGQSGTLANGFTYQAPPAPAPTLSGISPNNGTTAGGTSVTISGSNFVNGATVQLGGVAATNVVVSNSTTITATTPAHAAGAVNVVVTNPDGQSATLAAGFTYQAPSASMPRFGHVFVVVEENHSYGSVIGSAAMPYLNRLAQRYGLATNYYANTHPSIGNYFMLTTGQTITNDDSFTGTVSADNLVRQMVAAGKTWKAYAESLPAVGWTGGDQYPYVKHHNPFAYLTDVLNSTAQTNNLVPFSQFASDLANNQLPAFSYLLPNQLNNGHDCPNGSPCTDADKLTATDNWLNTNIAPLLASAVFQQDGMLLITWDESLDTDTANGGGHVATLIISPRAKVGYQSSSFYQHQSALRTIAEAMGLTGFPGASATATSMAEFFDTSSAPAPNVSNVTPNSGATSGGTSVTINGSGFANGATVMIGGVPATNVNVASSTTITAVTPAHAAGTVSVTVTNTNGLSATLPNGFTYQAPPPAGETVLLADDFNDNSLDTTKWNLSALFSGFTDASLPVQEVSQRLEIGPMLTQTAGSHYNGLVTRARLDFTNAYAYVWVQVPATNTTADAMLTLGLDANNYYRIYEEAGVLYAQKRLAGGSKVTLWSGAYDATQQRYWRMRHEATTGSVVFETAADNGGVPGVWVERYREAWSTGLIPVTSVLVEVKGGTWQAEASAAGKVIFDNFKAAKP